MRALKTIRKHPSRTTWTTVRIKAESHQGLKELAETTGRSVQAALDDAIEERRRRLYLEGINEDYAALKQDPKAAAELAKETETWDVTNLDGLENQ